VWLDVEAPTGEEICAACYGVRSLLFGDILSSMEVQ
jgi:hypothetical protein